MSSVRDVLYRFCNSSVHWFSKIVEILGHSNVDIQKDIIIVTQWFTAAQTKLSLIVLLNTYSVKLDLILFFHKNYTINLGNIL